MIPRERMILAEYVSREPDGDSLAGCIRSALQEIERLRGVIESRHGGEPLALLEELAAAREQLSAKDGEIGRLREANFYWDDRDHEQAYNSVYAATDCDSPNDIIELRPVHELPSVYVLVGEGERHVYSSREEAEKARDGK